MFSSIKKASLTLSLIIAIGGPVGLPGALAQSTPTQKLLQDDQIRSLREQIKIDSQKIAQTAAKVKIIETISSKDGVPLYMEYETTTKISAVVAVDAFVLAGMTKLGAFRNVPLGGAAVVGMGTSIILLWTSYFTLEGLEKLVDYSYYNEVKALDSTKRSAEYNQLIRSAADLKLSVVSAEAMIVKLSEK